VFEPFKRLAGWVLCVDVDPPLPPAGKDPQVFRASPSYLTYRMIPFFVGVTFELLVAAPALIGVLASKNVLALVGFLGSLVFLSGMTILSYFALRLDYELRYYVITDRSLRIREGAWTIREMTLTHANVQNLRIDQGPLQRLFGISDVVVDTAGGGAQVTNQPGGHGHHAVLAGIEDAEAVRDLLRRHVERAGRGDAGLGDERSRPKAAATSARLAGASPAVAAALREVRAAAAALREVAAARAAPGA
jgi:membrane protein YdbS with pleckstrin-like domain